MTALSVEKRRQVMQSRAAFWTLFREAVAADLAVAPTVARPRQPGARSPAQAA